MKTSEVRRPAKNPSAFFSLQYTWSLSSEPAMTDPEVLTEVPAALKRLAKYVVRGFYGIEHALALDILIRNPCVKEEDMLELLKFDRKQLRAVLNTLKGDKFIKCRMRVETAPDGKTTRHNYYFINYRLLVNVVKYKLDHMRRRIETDERDSTNRASFKCPICFSTFTDLEANQLFDPRTGKSTDNRILLLSSSSCKCWTLWKWLILLNLVRNRGHCFSEW